MQIPSANLAAIYLFFFIAGVLSIGRSLPVAFALGVGRRSYYAGTALLAISLAAVSGLALAVLQVIEQATGVVITSHAHAWPAIGRFFTSLSAGGLTGLLAALAVVLLAAGYTTMRRVTV